MAESGELHKLGELHRTGVLSDDEFVHAKARVLSGAARAENEAPGITAINALRRGREDRWLGGICGGVARITGLATWIWRLVFALLAICAGTGLLVYVLMWILVPLEEEPSASGLARKVSARCLAKSRRCKLSSPRISTAVSANSCSFFKELFGSLSSFLGPGSPIFYQRTKTEC